MIVIDIGCARYGGDYSLEHIISELAPEVIYGFDPSDALDPYLDDGERGEFVLDGCRVLLRKAAAWIYDGEVGFITDGLSSTISHKSDAPRVPCFDLNAFIRTLPSDQEIALKLDAEGAEYELLERLQSTRTDELLKLIWVEWHCLACGRGGGGHRPGCRGDGAGDRRRRAIERNLMCEVHSWNR